MDQTLKLIAIFATVMTFISGAMLAVVRFWMEKYLKKVEEQIATGLGALSEARKEDARQLRELQKEVSDFKASLPEKYVLRDDWLRFTTTLDRSLDHISENIVKMKEWMAKHSPAEALKNEP